MGQAISRIVLGVTGGIAAYKSVALVRRLRDAGFEVRVVMTEGAKAFVTPLSFQAVSGFPVSDDLLDPAAEAAMGHIELARWADLVVIAPASANTLAHLYAGMADDLLGTLVLATASPILLVPAMNQQMWASKAVQRTVAGVQELGYQLMPPAVGSQACGDTGAGRMPEPEAIVQFIQHWQHQGHTAMEAAYSTLLSGLHVAITAGPTREAIDPVRYLSNHSTGKMGYALAAACARAGARVTLISGPVSLQAPQGVERLSIHSARELLAESLRITEQGCDVFIGTAAVADYRAAVIAPQKIKKSNDTLTISLVKNPDVIATVAQHPKRPFMVGFAAETERVEDYARGKLASKALDMIACNDVSRTDIGFGSDDNAMLVFFSDRFGYEKVTLAKASKQVIARQLVLALAHALGRGDAAEALHPELMVRSGEK